MTSGLDELWVADVPYMTTGALKAVLDALNVVKEGVGIRVDHRKGLAARTSRGVHLHTESELGMVVKCADHAGLLVKRAEGRSARKHSVFGEERTEVGEGVSAEPVVVTCLIGHIRSLTRIEDRCTPIERTRRLVRPRQSRSVRL